MPTTTDWIMVVITGVYVLATIAICIANFNSAKAVRDQIAESQRQFQESNRPYVTCEYLLANRVFRGIRVCNHGNMVAKGLTIRVNQEFIDQTEPGRYIDFKKINSSSYSVIGIGQAFDFFFGDTEEENDVPLTVSLAYSDENNRLFSERFTIDLHSQLPIMSVESEMEKLIYAIKEIKNQMQFLRS